ncbi:MAG: hypothetical protein AAGF12_01515 [Myxococcota bacterium]
MIRLGLLALGVLTVVGCGRSYPMQSSTPVSLNAPVDPAVVRAAIVQAMNERGYATDAQAPGRVLGTYTRGRIMLQLAVDYNAGGYRINYVTSQGLRYRQRGAAAYISRRYDRYVNNLRRSIDRQLTGPPPQVVPAAPPQTVAAAHSPSSPSVAVNVPVTVQANVQVTPSNQAPTHTSNVTYAQRQSPQTPVVYTTSSSNAYAPNCVELVVGYGHAQTHTIHCQGADPYCAAALLDQGHSPVELTHCRSVEPQCASDLLYAGGTPVQLTQCR